MAEDCRHGMTPEFCADCRGLVEVTPDPYEGYLIDRFYQAAQHEQTCTMSFHGLQKHLIDVGSPFALAVHDGPMPFKRLGYVCEECMNRIAYPRRG